MPKQDIPVSSVLIRNCSANNLLIRHCSQPHRLSVMIIILSSFQLMYIGANPISFTVTENCQKNTIVGDMSIYKKINGMSPTQMKRLYSIESIGNEHLKDLFVIDHLTGIIKSNQKVDREAICPQLSATSGTCSVTLLVTIVNDIVNIVIIIVDENDNKPLFAKPSFTIRIKESTPVGTNMYLKHATDLDSLDNGIGEYQLTSESGTKHFSLKYNSTVIYLEIMHILDYELCQIYNLTLSVCDIGISKLCSSQTLHINIVDVNDNYPVFRKQNYFAIINEDHPVGRPVLQVSATDLDSKKYGLIKYQFASTSNEARKWFQLDAETGEIILLRPLSTVYKNFKFVVEARDNGPVPNVNRTMITIHIRDINNHFPDIKITESTFQAKIIKTGPNKSLVSFYENNPRNTDIVFIVVTDKDSDNNGRVHCSMEQFSSDWLKMLKFNSIPNKVIYRLVALISANCEEQKEITVVINCSDSGEHPKSTTHTITIRILDVNEFPAAFNKSSYSLSIRENTVSFSLDLPIHDEDCTSDLSVVIPDEYARSHFRYLRASRQLVLYSILNYEERPNINFTIVISNQGANDITLTSTTFLYIVVIDINDNAPVFIEPKTFHIAEDARPGSTIGYVKANDSDENQNGLVRFQRLNVSISQMNQKGSDHFLIGSDGLIKLAKELDREKQNQYFVSILATDMGKPPLSTTGTITIVVKDVNDNSPKWIFPNKNDNKLNESIYTRVGVIITRLHAIDLDEQENNNITYHIISDNAKEFFLHPTKGELSYSVPPKQGITILDIIAMDNGRPPKSNHTKLILYISDKATLESSGADLLASRSYFTLVAVVPIMILICILMLVLCLLLVVRRRNARNKNRRNQVNSKTIESLSRKSNNSSNTKEKLLQSKILDIPHNDNLEMAHTIDKLDLTQVWSYY